VGVRFRPEVLSLGKGGLEHCDSSINSLFSQGIETRFPGVQVSKHVTTSTYGSFCLYSPLIARTGKTVMGRAGRSEWEDI
jgi:hypothetical protein